MFDHVVLTASNDSQADAYRTELAHRGLDANSTPAATVVPDPRGHRIGSGVSTLLALADLAQRWSRDAHQPGEPAPDPASLFARKRVCIIHAGGDSRRLPAYAAHGKIFTPLPIDAPDPRHASLFDVLLDDYSHIPLPDDGRVVIATGDVFLDIGSRELGFDRPGVVGVAWASSPDRGSRHGVYKLDPAGEVTGFLHKPAPAEAAAGGAVRNDGTVLIDTGVVCLDPATVAHWLEDASDLLDRARSGASPQIDLYGDILPAIARHEPAHGIDWGRETPFHAAVVPTCPFLHIGSSRELLDVLTDTESHIATWKPLNKTGSRARVLNSRLDAEPLALGSRVLIESSAIVRAPSLPGNNILVGVPPELDRPIALPEGWGMVCLPIHDVHDTQGSADELWVAVCFGVEDDFKTPLHAGGTLGNRPMTAFLDRTGLDPSRLWPPPPDQQVGRDETSNNQTASRTFWAARLWTPAVAGAMLDPVAWMWSGTLPPSGWSESCRLTLAEVMAAVDHARLLDARARVLGCV